MTTKKFCVMTVGRSGSTALMNYLQQFDDIALPCKDIACIDNELLHPDFVVQYCADYAALTGQAVEDGEGLIQAFYSAHQQSRYAGFKSMPNRHPQILPFMNRQDIQMIALWREDVASTVASFLKAMDTGSWRRDGATDADEKWVFDATKHADAAFKNLAYVLTCNTILKNAPNAIKFSYEQLCAPDFNHAELNTFFKRNIKIAHPKPPTSAETYVENWAEFQQFILQGTQKLVGLSQQQLAKQNNKKQVNKGAENQPQKPRSDSEVQELSSIMPDLAQVLAYLEQLAFVAAKRQADFKDLQSLCLFIGYPRSGHSIVGALLDAHPEICIAQELDINRCIKAGMQRNTIFHLMTENSRIFTEQGKRWNTYNYQVPGQWQGKTTQLKVIGDKKGGGLSRALAQEPKLLGHLRSTFNLPLKFIHVVRNPYDNVATLAAKQKMSLDQAATLYFSMVAVSSKLKAKLSEDEIFEVSHEAFIADPKRVLSDLIHFLGLSATQEYLNACASIVSKTPHQSRHQAEWTAAQKDKMAKTMQQFAFLKHYQFEGE